MGKPEQGGSGAIIAVIVVGMLLLLVVVGGATVLVGGLLFVSIDSAPQQVMLPPATLSSGPMYSSQLIEIDAEGNISIDGELHTQEELRTHLLELQQESVYVSADPDCPEDVRANVISICEEVLGTTPTFLEIDDTAELVTPQSNETNEPN